MKSKVQMEGCVVAHLLTAGPLEKAYSPYSLLLGQSGAVSGALTTDVDEQQGFITEVINIQSVLRIPKILFKSNPQANLEFMVENLDPKLKLLGLSKFVLQPQESLCVPSQKDYYYFDILTKIAPQANLLLSFIACQVEPSQWALTMIHTCPLNKNVTLDTEIFNLTRPKKLEERSCMANLTDTLTFVCQEMQNDAHGRAHEALASEIRIQSERLKKAQQAKQALLDEINQIKRQLRNNAEISWTNYLDQKT
ncbi:uncharacterized protein LOC131881925 isoform X2 [Tigriopus californicus]|uniref:uncharacterized protein LOC131881925 isoform X2 n=1 Tax=Tigriopus californicus TaxID=6832 RepID=UPI0027DA5913|nr:uncharacterized protein LOC131881925 isoform X2 [Tigriopus californicus]